MNDAQREIAEQVRAMIPRLVDKRISAIRENLISEVLRRIDFESLSDDVLEATSKRISVFGGSSLIPRINADTVDFLAPNAGNTVQNLAGSGGAALVGFLPSGIGAIATDLQTRGRQIVYVTDFAANGVSGAKVDPTGVVDSVLGIQAAIDAVSLATQGVVIFPAGTFKVTAAPSIKSNVTLRGAGISATTIKLSGNPAGSVVKTAASATRAGVFDLTIDADKTNNANNLYGLYLDAATKCTVERVRVTNGKLHGIFLDTTTADNTVKNCIVDNWGAGSLGVGIVIFNGGLRNRIEGNTVDGTSQTNSGILVDASSTGGGGTPSSFNDVIGNTVLGCDIGITIEDSHACVVENNKVIGHVTNGILIQEGQDFLPPLGTVVRANRVSGGSNGIRDAGIGSEISGNFLTGQSSRAVLVQEINASRLVYGSRVVGNYIQAMNSGVVGIDIRGLACFIAGNFLYNVGTITYGIKIATGQTTSDNQARNNHFATGTYTAAIYAEEGSRLTIAGNRLLGITVTNGIQITAGVTSYHEDDNEGSVTGTFRSISATPIRLAFTNDQFGVAGNPLFTGHFHGRLCMGVPNSAPTDASISVSQMSFYLNAGETAIECRVRKSDGNYRSLTTAIAIS